MYPGERFNTYSHLSGLVLAQQVWSVMLLKAEEYGDGYRTFSVSVYGISLFLLYLSSSLYHGIKAGRLKSILKKVDHCMIYVLIAGSYTPFALVSLRNGPGWTVFLLSWLLAVAGIIQELTLGRKSEKTTAVYCDLCRYGLDGFSGDENPDRLPPGSRAGLAGSRRNTVQYRHLLVCKR